MARSQIKCDRPDQIMFTLETTMSCADFRRMLKQIEDLVHGSMGKTIHALDYPLSAMVYGARDVIAAAEKHFYVNYDEPDKKAKE